ncbi:MAG: SUMF1/EgtB/PvdO family nonheme iron enzyme [Saprospiraceae bacterium]|nr:SUMF1/EgtB/PvdO family nonheme iron enzyme [Saprospiraceae bacterium]
MFPPLKTFIIYARADARYKDELLTHLRPFVKNELLEKWVDSDLLPGEEWEKRIEKELEAAHLVILLVSADAINSDFIEKKELKIALEKKRAGSARVAPILVRDCFWEMHQEIAEMQLLPKDEAGNIRGVAGWNSTDSAWTSCVRELKRLVDEIREALIKEAEEAKKLAEAQKKQAEAEAEKAEQKRSKVDEAAWKKVMQDLEKAADRPEKIDLLQSYLHDEAHQNHRAEAQEMLEDLEADVEAERKLVAAKKKREAEAAAKKKEAEDAERKKREAEESERKKQALPDMVFVKGGTFKMGGKFDATLSDFEIGKYPVTQKFWKEIMGSNPSYFKGDDLPMENVSWDDCQVFLNKLNALHPNHNYRLPTEAEWEFAARGGVHSKGFEYAGSNDLEEVGWYDKNSGSSTNPIGQKKVNELGIHDMSGNVWEWCHDWYGDYPTSPQNNPQGPTSGSYRVRRGGSWDDFPALCRVARRSYWIPDNRRNYLGFRLARTK